MNVEFTWEYSVMAAPLLAWWRKASKRRFIRYGAPFLVMIVAGSFGLKQFTSMRYQFRKSQKMTPDQAEQYGIKMKREKISLESEYQSMQEIKLDTWQNVRGPRPWENSREVQDAQRQEAGGSSVS